MIKDVKFENCENKDFGPWSQVGIECVRSLTGVKVECGSKTVMQVVVIVE